MLVRRFIFVNGPPQSGKDTVCNILQRHADLRGYAVHQEKLAEPLRSMAMAMVPGVLDSEYEDFKRRAHPPFERSGRQLMIDISERFMKPEYGRDIFSQLLLTRIGRMSPQIVNVISDSGFQHEVDYFHSMGHDVVVANVHRPGHDFRSDSREWVRSPCSNRESFQIDNSGSMDHLHSQVRGLWRYACSQFGI